MNRCLLRLFLTITFLVTLSDPSHAVTALNEPAQSLVGEKLTYNISFLWFNKIARGEIHFQSGEKEGTYLATLTAETRGMAAFFTRNRVETFKTLMEEGPDGLLRPLLQTSDTKKGDGDDISHRQTSYSFDFSNRQVIYKKTTNGEERDKTTLPMVEGEPTYDFLTAFYNLRLGRFGDVVPGRNVRLSAFSRKGPEEIVISRLAAEEQARMKVPKELILCKVLMSPETFKSKNRDLYVGFDEQLRPQMAVIKKVIGLGDVLGELVHSVEPAQDF